MAKDIMELFEEFEEYGYVLHECPKCGEECEPTEIDNDKAFCSSCNRIVNVPVII